MSSALSCPAGIARAGLNTAGYVTGYPCSGTLPAASNVNYTAAGQTVANFAFLTPDAAGDVCSRFTFTHAADAMARIVIQNALFYGRRKASALVIPWATYTDPEIVVRVRKSHHAGLIVASPDSARVVTLLRGYTERFYTDFHASAPPPERPTD